jgi:hypothetical protein
MENQGYRNTENQSTDYLEGMYNPVPRDTAVRDPQGRLVEFYYVSIPIL